jgi:hypothetical protein
MLQTQDVKASLRMVMVQEADMQAERRIGALTQ